LPTADAQDAGGQDTPFLGLAVIQRRVESSDPYIARLPYNYHVKRILNAFIVIGHLSEAGSMQRILAAGLALAVVLALFSFWFGGSGEPSHQGKPASYWRTALKSEDPDLRRQAITALGALKCKDVFPELIAAVGDKDPRTRAKAAEALWSLGGSDTKDAIPALLPLLKDKESAVRLSAAGALGQIGPEAASAVKALKGALQDGDAYVRAQAATSLGRIGKDSATIVPALTQLLKDRDKHVRVAAIYALGEFGAHARSAIPELREMARAKDGDVKTAAAFTLKAIEGNE